ncbi:hypothetical protein ACIP1T_21735 [Pseudomonas japonica]|uniref:hypothetical protein n=1 Tax=Pseudomonas japonica TaxID=256466 RepID=UPI00380B8070
MTTFSMIDINTWSTGERLIFSSGWIVLGLLDFALTIYIYKKHLPDMIAAFDNSPLIKSLTDNLENQGLIARSLSISFISGAITYAPSLVEQGHVSASDVARIPVHVRRLLSTSSMLSSITLLWLAVVGILALIRGNSLW